MRKPTDHSYKPPDTRDPETLELAFKAHAFRVALDAMLAEHGVRMVLAHQGKWAHVQVQWPGASQAISIMRASRDGRVRYLTEAEEDAAGPSTT
jgi:hypothetical protein